MATENGIAAIGKMIKSYRDIPGFDVNTNIVSWIEALPLLEDTDEAPEVYKLLLELINNQHPSVTHAAHIPKLASILIQALCRPTILNSNPKISHKMLVSLAYGQLILLYLIKL